jgi:peptidyl-prolyl cis-trans isomerase C
MKVPFDGCSGRRDHIGQAKRFVVAGAGCSEMKGDYLMITRGARCFSMLLAAALFSMIAWPVSGADDKASAGKVAVVNETVITKQEFERELNRVKQRFVSINRPLMDSQLPAIKKDVLEDLINRELLYQESKKEGLSAKSAEVDKQLSDVRKRFSDETEFKNALSSLDLTEAKLRSQIEKAMMIQGFVDKKFAEKAAVPEEEVKDYYSSHPSFFKQPEQVRASHILIKLDPNSDASRKAEARKKIEEIQQKLKQGEDFGGLARKFSECPSSNKDGDLGYFRRGQMVKPFEEAAFSGKPGEISGIVETQFGYHLIKVVEKKPEATMPFKDAKERISDYLKQEKVQKEIDAYLAKLKQKAIVERFPKALGS